MPALKWRVKANPPYQSPIDLVHLFLFEGVGPRQIGIFPAVDDALTGLWSIFGQIALDAIDYGIHVLETRLGEKIGGRRAAISRATNDDDDAVGTESLFAQSPAHFGHEVCIIFELQRRL